MKQEFWMYQYEILFFWPFIWVISLACLLTGIVMTLKSPMYWPILVFGAFCLIFCICIIFFQKKLLCKVVFSNEGITIKRLGKILTTMQWIEVLHIEGHLYGSNGGRYMSFISQSERIDVVPTKKMYNTIMLMCPNSKIKKELESIECIKCFHREK